MKKNLHTIIIVTGCAVQCEIFDRYLAYYLKFLIDSMVGFSPGVENPRPALVIGDIWLREEYSNSRSWLYGKHNLISIGGPNVNSRTGEILRQAHEQTREAARPIGLHPRSRMGVFSLQNGTQAVLYGDSADDTRNAVAHFIGNDQHSPLYEYLRAVWGG